MAQMPESDFASFLDIDLDLAFYDAEAHQKQPQQHSTDQIEQQNAVFDFSLPLDVQFSMAQQQQSQAHALQSGIPPTPNSVEMHSATTQYLQHMEAQQRAIIDQYHLKRPQNTFTPTPSPIVNANYTVPGAYFSPLTSPALEAQSYSYQSNPSASSIATSSLVDLDVGMPDVNVTQQQMTPAMMSRKRPNPARSNNNRIPNSPVVRQQRGRRSKLSVTIAEDEARELIRDRPRSNAPVSSTDSISPEPLNDSSMPPPHRPASATPSPALLAKSSSMNSQRHGPATPASLMKMQQARSSPRSNVMQSPGLSSDISRDPMLPPLSLPEAAAGMTMAIDPDLSPADHDSISTSRKTPKLGPLSTPSGSATPAPSLSRTSTSTTSSPLASTFPSRKSETKGRTSKKRGSMSSNNLVSPALRPKISPSIKPLLPDGSGSNDDAHTVFLASRSNYQNLIEGTHVPGVSYPTELSTNLTSKRTSHKIAEQGRRNRINLALQEMLHLLPKASGRGIIDPSSPKPDDDAGKKSDGGGKSSGNSKAATVESAIEYIKALKRETEEMSKMAEAKDKECELLRRKLKDMEKMFGEKSVTPPVLEEDENETDEENRSKS